MEASASATSRLPTAALQARRRSICCMNCPINACSALVTSDRRGNRILVFGVGYVGRFVSEQLKREGWYVSGTCRDAIKKRELEILGLDAFLFETNNSKLRTLSTLHDATHILISVPPIAGVGDPLICLHEDLQRSLSCGNVQWLGYLSSTSVYGDCGGGWVDEECPVNPKMESAMSRLAAEKGWLQLGRELGLSINVFRLGGIYGLGRRYRRLRPREDSNSVRGVPSRARPPTELSALDTIIKKKSSSEKQRMRESRIYTSRVHVADIYQSIKASFNAPSSGRIYNVVDDDPAPRAEVFAFARDLIKKKWPGVIMDSGEAAGDDSVKEDSAGEKLVSNARIKHELGVRLLYPTYREGLESIIRSMDIPSSSKLTPGL